jgi:O-antigen/teichoic acid export membrane protein
VINVSRGDVYWSYLAQIFNVGSGLIVLPYVLSKLTSEEIGLNYIMLTFSSFVALLDFGFTPQFSRNISYVLGGAQALRKEGIEVAETSFINYRLLATTIEVGRFVYKRLAAIALILLLSIGSWYIWHVTNGGVEVSNSFLVWLVFSVGVYFNIYFAHYQSLLIGAGLIRDYNRALIFSRIVYIGMAYLFLLSGFSLLGVVIANVTAPFVSRYIAYKAFFSEKLRKNIENELITKEEISETFEIIWHNARKLGLVMIGSFAIGKFSMFIAGLFLPLSDIASFGLMSQLFGILSTISGVFFNSHQARFSSLRAQGNKQTLLQEFAYSMVVFYVLFVVGSFFLILAVPKLLLIIGAAVELPSIMICGLFALVLLLEANHSNFASFIVTANDVPFVRSALIAGAVICILDLVVLKWSNFGLIGLVLIQGVVQVAYANWKWPLSVLKEFNLRFSAFLLLGITQGIMRLMYGARS